MSEQANANKIVVTGSTGLIGQALVREIIAKNVCYLRLPVRNVEKAKIQLGKIPNLESGRCQIEFIQCDLTKLNDQDFDRLVGGCQSIIHLAGLVHQTQATEEEYNLLNVEVTEKLLKAATHSNIHTFIFTSSMAVYGPGPYSMIDESAPLLGQTPYAVSKIACEQILEKVNSIRRVIILRPALVFGAGDKGNLIKLIQAVNKGRYFNIGRGQTAKSLIFASDLAAAINLCLDKLPKGTHIFNAANRDPVSMKELTKTISLALAQNGKILSLPEPFLRAMIKTADLVLPAPLRRKLPTSLEQLDKLTTTTTCSVDKLIYATGFGARYSLLAAITAEICWAKNNNLLN
jgi:GlcNAc-P-P-Und epimerase